MGTLKISQREAREIVNILVNWPTTCRLTWEILRSKISQRRKRSAAPIWSRQSLSAHEDISLAFSSAKAKIATGNVANSPTGSLAWYSLRVKDLEHELDTMRRKMEVVQLRHTQLLYNATLLPGGAKLLIDPLPNNSRTQSN
jgi:hypothetical protein